MVRWYRRYMVWKFRMSRTGISRAGVGRAGVSRAGVSRAGVSRSRVSCMVCFSPFPFDFVRHLENLRQNFSFLPPKVDLCHDAPQVEEAYHEPSQDSRVHLATV